MLWARHDVVRREGATTTLNHPQVSEITLYREKLALLSSYVLPARNPQISEMDRL